MISGRFVWAAMVVLCVSPAVSAAGEVRRAQVVDPLGAAVPGARVASQCPGQTRRADDTTDEKGVVTLPADPRCAVTVTARGFQPWVGTVSDVTATDLIRLAIAPLEQAITVRGSAAPLSWTPIGSVSLRPMDLDTTAWDAARLVAYAKARAGATLRDDRIYVDGLPASVLPRSDRIEQLTVNADPFSAAYSESDQNVIDIVSATPDRTFRWSTGAVPRAFGGRNPLAPALELFHRSFDVSLAGPVPRAPFTFALDGYRSRSREGRAVAVSPAVAVPAASGMAAYGVSATLVGELRDSVRTRLAITAGGGGTDAADVGGFTRPDAAQSSAGRAAEIRFTVDAGKEHHRFRSGIVYGVSTTSLHAASEEPGLLVLDTLVAGGAPVAASDTALRNWTWNASVTPVDESWVIGWAAGTERSEEQLLPNRYGQSIFGTPAAYDAARDGAIATRVRLVGALHQMQETTTAALYAQKPWRLSPAVAVRAGIRADYQSGDSVALSPRLSWQARRGTVKVQSGAGVFRQSWSTDVLMRAGRFREGAAEWQMVDGSLDAPGSVELVRPVHSVLDPAFARPRSLVISNGIERRLARIAYGVEHRWTTGAGRVAARRQHADAGWVDVLESSRSLVRHQIHTSLEYILGRGTITAHYEWMAARDNGDGPFASPAAPDDVSTRWARAAGVSRHHVSVVVSPPAVAGVSSGVIVTSRSAAPLDIRAGRDLDGSLLYADRGGLRRNAGTRPGYQSVDAYLQRRTRLPGLRWRGDPLFVDALATADNLLGLRNYGSIGAVSASPFFGRPVTASQGRALRVTFRVTR